MKKIYELLKEAGVYYLATVEGNQPRVRPFGTVLVYEDRLYIQTGKSKPVSHQLKDNPHSEICAFNKGIWIRVSGELINDDRLEVKKAMLDAYPNLRSMYDENDDNTQVLYFKNGKASICGFGKDEEIIEF